MTGRSKATTKFVALVPLLLALGLLALQVSRPAALRRRILLELHDELEGGGPGAQRLPIDQLVGLEVVGEEGGMEDQLPQAHVKQHQQQILQQQRTPLQQGGGGSEAAAGVGPAAAGPPAAPQFVGYIPSQWELDWQDRAQLFQEDPSLVCATMLQEAARSRAWVNATSRGASLAVGGGSLALDPAVFSRFMYRDLRSGEEYGVWIEPLVGHFRHPYNPAPCVPGGMPPLPIQDRSYVLMHGIKQHQFQRLYPGKKYLLDLGTANFPTSLGWFLEQYGGWGVEFDEIWAWEAESIPPQDYWAKVPPAVLPHLHFYNVPVTVDASRADNPINIIKGMYRPGDFVVVKLDIDNAPLEAQLMEQVRRDPEAINMIAEMMFEMHYDHPDMSMAFGHPNSTWIEVGQLFGELRSKGLRLHYWP